MRRTNATDADGTRYHPKGCVRAGRSWAGRTILGRSNAPRGTGTRPQDEPNPRASNSRRERRVLATLVGGSVRGLLRQLSPHPKDAVARVSMRPSRVSS